MIKHMVLLRLHSAKSVCIRSCSSPYFPAFELNTERYKVSLRIQSECMKTRTRITPNTDTFHAVLYGKIIHVDYNVLHSKNNVTETIHNFKVPGGGL